MAAENSGVLEFIFLVWEEENLTPVTGRNTVGLNMNVIHLY